MKINTAINTIKLFNVFEFLFCIVIHNLFLAPRCRDKDRSAYLYRLLISYFYISVFQTLTLWETSVWYVWAARHLHFKYEVFIFILFTKLMRSKYVIFISNSPAISNKCGHQFTDSHMINIVIFISCNSNL